MKRILLILALLIPQFAEAQGSLLPDVLQQFTDTLGVPIASGYICATISGTSTNLAVYPTAADANAGTNAYTNPVQLDSAGRKPLWLGTGTYRIIVFNPVGVGSGTCNGTAVGSAVKTVDGVAGYGSLLATNNTFTGTNTFTGAVTTTSFNNRQFCTTGANFGVKFTAAAALLPSTGGIVDCSNLQGAQTIASDVFTSQTKPLTVIWPIGAVSSAVSLTVPATMTIDFSEGGILSMASATTATLNGEIRGTLSQHFTGSGNAMFTGSMGEVRPEWWGAKADGSTASQSAFTSMVAALPATGYTVRLACGTYVLTGWTITDKRVNIIGCGAGGANGATDAGTILKSTTNAAVLKLTASAYNSGLGRYNSIRDFKVLGGTGIGTAQHCIQVDNMGVIAYNVYAFSCGGHGWFLTASVGSQFYNVQALSNNLDGMNIDDSGTSGAGGAVTDTALIGGQYNSNGRDGVRIVSNGWGTTSAGGTVVEGNTGYGLNFVSSGTSTQYSRLYGVWDESNTTGSVHFGSGALHNEVHYLRFSSGYPVNDSSANINVVDGANLKSQTATVTSSSIANPSVLTIGSDIGLVTGNLVILSGHTGSTPSLNGNIYVVTKLTGTTFSIPVNVTVGGTGGSLIALASSATTGAQQLIGASNGVPIIFRDPRQIGFVPAQADAFIAQFACGTKENPALTLTTDAFRSCNNRGLATLTTAGTDSTVVVLNNANDVVLGDASANSVKIGAPYTLEQTSTFAALPTPSGGNGSHLYCSDCKNSVDNAVAVGANCANGGAGALAIRENGAWRCF